MKLRTFLRTPGTTYAGGHRIRVTPVPIPNTEVKPDTADGTARETVWESRSLPAVIQKQKARRVASGLLSVRLMAGVLAATQFPSISIGAADSGDSASAPA